ncbi:MAG TPA: DNA polymerase III subunit chi [Burkholderiaceae bacterium]|jgi:DNA polymerase III subunit chi|nr:DNA polymerase III subunit chi [Burkholderiaceae bacterium]
MHDATAPAASISRVVIDFHFNVDHPVIHACRVVRKALGSGRSVLAFSRDAQRLARLDSALWTFSALDFLPHVYADSELADRTPVWLSMTPLPDRERDVLLLLDEQVAPDFERWFERFERVIEIVSNEDDDRAHARARFKAYRDRGFVPRSHQIAAP